MKKLGLLVITIFWLGGCASGIGNVSPKEVAEQFWTAMIKQDLRKAKSLTIRQKIETKTVVKVKPEKVTTLGARVVNGRAFVPTRMIFTIPLESVKSAECNASFDTELLKVEGRWLIDDVVTMENYRKSIDENVVGCGSKMLDKAIEEGLKEFEIFQEELGKEGEKFGKILQQSMEKWKEEVIKALQEMQKSLEKMPPPEQNKGSEPKHGERI